MRGLQTGIHRTSNKTIEFFWQYSAVQEGVLPLCLSIVACIYATNSCCDFYSRARAVAAWRTLGGHGAVYFEPIFVRNSNTGPDVEGIDNDTVMLGVAARLRLLATVYLVGEILPRVSGYDPGVTHASFALEKRAGGHMFQLNFSNGFGTTMGQLARGGFTNDDWYLGFNISRKFF